MKNFGGKKFGGSNRRSGGRSFGGGRGGNRGFGGGRDGNRGFGGGRDGNRPVTMHKVVCDECGKNCEVPFRPTGDKPVFCSDCFANKGNNTSRGSRDGGKREFNERDRGPRFRDRESYQSDDKDTENHKAQFEMLNTKLDKILKALSSDVSKEKKKVDTVTLKKVLKKATKKKPAAR